VLYVKGAGAVRDFLIPATPAAVPGAKELGAKNDGKGVILC